MGNQNSANQIRQMRSNVRFSVCSYPISYIVSRFSEGELYVISDYEHKSIWTDQDKCYFIESLLAGFPTPLMCFSDTEDGRIGCLDGVQRILAIAQFCNDELELKNLKLLDESNGLRFSDLDSAIQKRFENTDIKAVFLKEWTSLAARDEIFKRINIK